MKHWQEARDILAHLESLRRAGKRAAIASVVQIAGSAYRRPGARLLIGDDGSTRGGISGGCLEEDVRRAGLEVIEQGRCRLLHYETGEDEDALWGLGLGCNGEVDIFVQPTHSASFADTTRQMRSLLDGCLPFAAVTVTDEAADELGGHVALFAGESLIAGHTGDATLDAELAAAVSGTGERRDAGFSTAGDLQVFVEPFEPPPFLLVCGAGDDAIPLVAHAAVVGFRIVVVDHRPAYLGRERFPEARELIRAVPEDEVELPTGADTFVVLKTHNLARDKAWARRFLATDVPYIGILGPRDRCEEIAAACGDAAGERVYGPVGLDLGSEGPEQVGLSIVAELLAVRSQRIPRHLRDRKAAIHV